MSAVRLFKMLAAAVILTLGLAGCGGDNGVNSGGGEISGSKISVNGAQVYVNDYEFYNTESKYTGSFTYSMNYRLTDAFANPVVRMTNGKLTINLGEPIGGLERFKDVFRFESGDGITISDPTAKILVTGWFGGEDGYFDGDEFISAQYCDPNLLFVDVDLESIVFFIYADKPVTISGSYGWDDNCPISFSLKKGWNTIAVVYKGEGCESLEHITADLSGSGAQKWIVSSSTEDSEYDGLKKSSIPTRQSRFFERF